MQVNVSQFASNYSPKQFYIMFRSNWMNLEEWHAVGLPIKSTTSNEAVKLYDAALAQFVGYYDEPSLNGMIGTLADMWEIDPEFILGQSLLVGINLLGLTETYFNEESIRETLNDLQLEAGSRSDEMTPREKGHLRAVTKLAKMDWDGAVNEWDFILRHWPNDVHALKMASQVLTYTGRKQELLRQIVRSYPHLEKKHLYALDGNYAFALVETGQYEEGRRYANKGLERSACDGLSMHAMAHIYEMTGRAEEGIQLMRRMESQWTRANHAACHNFWHLSLFHTSLDQFEEAIDIFDTEIMPRLRESGQAFQVADAASLLYRLQLLDSDKYPQLRELSLEAKYREVYSFNQVYLKRHVHGFLDTHYLMAMLGSGHQDEAKNLLQAMESSKLVELHPLHADITEQVMQAMIHFEHQRYSRCTEILFAIRDQIVHLGSSDAERDVFNQLAMVSAFKSSKEHPSHVKILEKLVHERDLYKPNDSFVKQLGVVRITDL